jgi:hypothetical protein
MVLDQVVHGGGRRGVLGGPSAAGFGWQVRLQGLWVGRLAVNTLVVLGVAARHGGDRDAAGRGESPTGDRDPVRAPETGSVRG